MGIPYFMDELVDFIHESRRLLRASSLLRQGLCDVPSDSSPAPSSSLEPAPAMSHSTTPSVLHVALRALTLGIHDSLSGAWFIDRCIRGPYGLTWGTVETGPDARPNIPYQKNGDFAWCLAFVAAMHGLHGLDREIRRKLMASTYRLWNAYRTDTDRFITEPDALLPGDTVVVGPTGPSATPWGEHGLIFWGSFAASSFDTIEGNARGHGEYGPDGPTGPRYEGVVCNRRPFKDSSPKTYVFRFGIRFKPSDYGPPASPTEVDAFFRHP